MALAITELKNNCIFRTVDFKKIMAIAGIMKLRDSYTENHGRRVSAYSQRLAQRIGLSSMAVGRIAIGGMLHDIGKVCMSDRIFTNQSARLSDGMMAEVRRHPVNGVMLLKDVDYLQPVLKYILFHHERLDGGGYPFGLKAEDIPLGAQIISVADYFDAITTDRPYKRSKGPVEAFDILEASSGTALNSALVKALITDVEENGMVLTDP